ncbi:putative RNA polymerase Rpb7-like domain-containing protein [Rosellinia necatrix]|uniref:DNA-directed RNA polymerase subunit n=1 Tax=Rosellinia necatrix TaxID=77044 RepID=A0A1W2TRU3_ROSNE|nr:putative RNA polymerase Rpb7-like domain-containing protein [Rosellinia necatrix]
MAEVATTRLPLLPGPPGAGEGSLRKSSKHKDSATSKKRHRDTSQAEKAERKHKKSRSDAVPALGQTVEEAEDDGTTAKRKRKSHKSSKTEEPHISLEKSQAEATPARGADEGGEDDGGKRLGKKKAHRKETKKPKNKHKESRSRVSNNDDDNDDNDNNDNNDNDDDDDDDEDNDHGYGHPDIVVLNSSRSAAIPGRAPSKHQYPFYTQTVSQYLPLHPLGLNEPIQGYLNQHLEPLLNRYVPSFGGVLLACRHPRIGETPGSSSLTEESAMNDVAVFESINEHAVSFGWLTVEIDVFQPSRGAWLEGLVNIQSGGHIGVVCWGKFNASIEAERLPRDWRWIDHHPGNEENSDAETESPSESPGDDAGADHGEVHTTGHWVDGQGSKITADTPIRFRIKNYEVGNSGDYGYLSIEGTMLTEDGEMNKVRKEMEGLRHKLKHGTALRRERRLPLDLSITKFTNDDGKESEGQAAAA